jgi:hypothetical protein
MARKAKKHIGFSVLSGEVTREYERKGYSKKRASVIGHDVAGKVARIKNARRVKRTP